MIIQQRLAEGKAKYFSGPYNIIKKNRQRIRISDGCPRNCPYCYCPTEIKKYKIPSITKNQVDIIDMNILATFKDPIELFNYFSNLRVDNKVVYYNVMCGFDYRYINQEIADSIKKARIKKIRMAWDWFYKDQIGIKNAIDMFLKAGYNSREIMIFMICNWKISYKECCDKLDLLKVWNVEVCDCYYDNQTFPNVIPLFWKDQENKSFRERCRKHNQLVYNRFDPELNKIKH